MSESPKEAAMLPDSTQSGNVRPRRKNDKKRKKKEASGRKKKAKDGKLKEQKESVDGGPPSDLDLTKPLFPISHYISDREEMLQQAFESVSKEQIDAMMPDILKECPMEVVKALCLGQLEGMSKKRILHVLAGEEMLSSSDTDESDIDEQPPVDEPEADLGEPLEDEADLQGDAQGEQHGDFMEDYMEEEPLEPEGSPPEGMEYEAMVDGDNEMFDGKMQGGETSPQPEMGMSPEYVLDSADELGMQQAEDPPQKRRKKRKKKPRMINPVDLEEGEVSEESSEYTDASGEDSNEQGIELEGAMTGTLESSEGAVPPGVSTGEVTQDSTAGELGHEVGNEGTLTKNEGTCRVDNVGESEVTMSVADNQREGELLTPQCMNVESSETAETKVGNDANSASILEISDSNSGGASKSNVNNVRTLPTSTGAVVCNVPKIVENVDSNSETVSKSDNTIVGTTQATEGAIVASVDKCSDSNSKEAGLMSRVTATGRVNQIEDEAVVNVSEDNLERNSGSQATSVETVQAVKEPAVFSIPGTIDSTTEVSSKPVGETIVSQISTGNSKDDTLSQVICQGTSQENQLAVVYNVSSSEVEDGKTESEGVTGSILLGSPNVCESEKLTQSDRSRDNVVIMTANTGGTDNQPSTHSRVTQTPNLTIAPKDQQTEISPEAEGDSLSVNNDSEFDDEESEDLEVKTSKDSKQELPDDQLSVIKSMEESQSDQERSDQLSEESDSVEESGEDQGASSDEQSSSSGSGEGSSVGAPKLVQSNSGQEAETDETANMEPKLNILELELRARAIRSLMKHCAAVEKLT